MQKQIIRHLLNQYLRGDATAEEREDLLGLINSEEELFLEVFNQMQKEEPFKGIHADKDSMEKALQQVLSVDRTSAAVHVINSRPLIRKYWAAASVVLLLGMTIVLYNLFKGTSSAVPVAALKEHIAAPDANRATITLTDGRTVYLDEIANGEIADQGNARLIKLANGQIAYETTKGVMEPELQYNTLTNPRGSKIIDMKLSDGTHVWLNAGSSVTYPVAFTGKERGVTLNGEGYFEVAHNPSIPFMVNTGTLKIKVLGTHFNVNAYADEGSTKATLLEGKIEVSNDTRTSVLMPGQQVTADVNGKELQVKENVDLEQVMAWKNGYFSFDGADLKEVMQQISRWYDVEVEYEGSITLRKFVGGIARNSPLGEVLNILQETNPVNFKLEGRKIVIKAKN